MRGEWACQGRWRLIDPRRKSPVPYSRFDFCPDRLHLILQKEAAHGAGGGRLRRGTGRPSAGESSCANYYRSVGTFSLETCEDVALVKDAVADAVPTHAAKAVDGCTDYRDDISLTDEQIAMVEWADLGAPEGNSGRGRASPPRPGPGQVDPRPCRALRGRAPAPTTTAARSGRSKRRPLSRRTPTGPIWSIVIASSRLPPRPAEAGGRNSRAGNECFEGREQPADADWLGCSTRCRRNRCRMGWESDESGRSPRPPDAPTARLGQRVPTRPSTSPSSHRSSVRGGFSPSPTPDGSLQGGWTFRHRRKARSRASRTPWRGT